MRHQFARSLDGTTLPEITMGNPPSMGRPCGVSSSKITGGEYVMVIGDVDDCNGVYNTTLTPTPKYRGAIHVNIDVDTRTT